MLFLLFAQAAAAQADAGAAPLAATPPRPVAEKKICRTEESTGSRLHSTRICMTAREWDTRSQDAQDEQSRMSRAMGGGPPHF